MVELDIIELLQNGTPLNGMPGFKVLKVEANPVSPTGDILIPDVALSIDFSGTSATIYGHIKTQLTPKSLKEVVSWLLMFKKPNLGNPMSPYILICPFLSPKSQRYCLDNGIGFIDMSGNVFIEIPGKLLVQRLDRPNAFKTNRPLRNPFDGVSSRIIRVLLKNPKKQWTVGGVNGELTTEFARSSGKEPVRTSLSIVSKVIDVLDELLLIRRDGTKIYVNEPKRLLLEWAEKYRQSFRFKCRSSWICPNPFSADLKTSLIELNSKFPDAGLAVSGTAAANLKAPFVNVDKIHMYIMNPDAQAALYDFSKTVNRRESPDFVFSKPYDAGVGLYSSMIDDIKTVSNVQIFLDCYARGGRDFEQADHILETVIAKEWGAYA